MSGLADGEEEELGSANRPAKSLRLKDAAK
jgi:hypothetical protein